jgi:hypothetical protein
VKGNVGYAALIFRRDVLGIVVHEIAGASATQVEGRVARGEFHGPAKRGPGAAQKKEGDPARGRRPCGVVEEVVVATRSAKPLFVSQRAARTTFMPSA